VTAVIRFRCEACGKQLAVQDSRAGTRGTCPDCKEPFRVPGDRQAEESSQQPRADNHEAEVRDPASADRGPESEVMLSFSRSGLRKSLAWVLFFQLGALLLLVGASIGCVVIVQKEQVSFQMILGLLSVALVGVVGLCYFLMALPNWRLFFFSTIPSSSYYLVTSDRLVRYSRRDEVLEEIPFANIADVSLVTKRNEENPEVTARVLGIDLRNLNDRKTILDQPFCRWSQKMHQYDLVLIEDFFAVPLKTVYRKIKRRWQQWQETNPRSAEATDTLPRPRRRRRLAWYQKPLTYVFGGLGLGILVGLVVLLILLGRDRNAGNAPAPAAGPGAGPQQVNKAASEPFGPKSLPGLLAYWPLDEAQGQAANDASGNGSLGHIHGGEWLQGVKGSALRLVFRQSSIDG
jgi:hypothetical protein